MSQSRKKRTADRAVVKAPGSKAIHQAPKGRRIAFIIASVVIVLILAIVGISLYISKAPFRLALITVDDTSIRMDYFLKRTQLAGSDPISMLDVFVNEQLVKVGAPRYVGEVSPEDIDQALRYTSNTTSESEFKAWYRQQLNETRLSGSEYKDMVATGILASRLHEYLAKIMPTAVEQVHLNIITVATYQDAEKVRARWKAGEDFADLAREVSSDSSSKENGGDLGWYPAGVLDSQLDYYAFSLSTDNISESLAYYDLSNTSSSDTSSTEPLFWYLLMVSEKADAKEVDEKYLPAVADKAFYDWLSQETQFHEISYHGLNKGSGFDSETYAWINLQLAKNQSSSTQTSSGTSGGQ